MKDIGKQNSRHGRPIRRKRLSRSCAAGDGFLLTFPTHRGTLTNLRATLGIVDTDFDQSAALIAAGADYPNWPDSKDVQHTPNWASARFVDKPVLIHPLTGDEVELQRLNELDLPDLEAVGLNHFNSLIERTPAGIDYRLTHLAFWRFGPEPKLVAPKLGAVWHRMPADPRAPDRSVWAHLDLVSAIVGAKLDGEPALLTMSFVPVQGFIAQARSVSDLWAGSHLLSSLVWAGLQVLCEELVGRRHPAQSARYSRSGSLDPGVVSRVATCSMA